MESRDNRKPHRTIRVEDDLWQAAQEAARWRGEASLSNVVRRGLITYVRATEKKRREEESGQGPRKK